MAKVSRREAFLAIAGAFIRPDSCQIEYEYGRWRTVYGVNCRKFFFLSEDASVFPLVKVHHRATGRLIAVFGHWTTAEAFCRRITPLTNWAALTVEAARANASLKAQVRAIAEDLSDDA